MSAEVGSSSVRLELRDLNETETIQDITRRMARRTRGVSDQPSESRLATFERDNLAGINDEFESFKVRLATAAESRSDERTEGLPR